MRFRKKPVVIEAYCYNQVRENYRPDWFSDAVSNCTITTFDDHADIHTLEGTMRADLGDWVIKGVKGELYPCKPDIFSATYDAVDVTPPTIAELEKLLNSEDDTEIVINPDGSISSKAA